MSIYEDIPFGGPSRPLATLDWRFECWVDRNGQIERGCLLNFNEVYILFILYELYMNYKYHKVYVTM